MRKAVRPLLLLIAGLVASCAAPSDTRPAQALEPTPAGYPRGPVTLIAPANPGGGWDQTARQIQQVWTELGVLGVPVDVENRGGAGGTIGLADLVARHRGEPHTLMVFGQVLLGAILTNDSPLTVDDTVPLARLLNEYEIVAVPTDSPYETIQGIVEDLRADPGSVSWAGGSAGGIDHILVGLIAQAAGVDPRLTNYIAYAGGGEAAAAVMGGHVTVGVSGLGEWKSHVDAGRLRLLAVSSAERVGDRSTPTLVESGLDVVISNWRGLLAPPGTDSVTRDWLVTALERLQGSTAWQDILTANDWEDSFLSGDAFAAFLERERDTADAALRAVGLVQSGSPDRR